MATIADLMYAGVDETDPKKRRILEEELARAMAQLQSGSMPVNTPQEGVVPPADTQTLADLPTSAYASAPTPQAPVQRFQPGTVTKLAPTTSDAERVARDMEFRAAVNANRQALEDRTKPATDLQGMMNQIMAMAKPGYIGKSNDPAYSSIEYKQGMPIAEIMKTPQFQMLQAMSPMYKQQAEINRLNAEAEKERALASGGGMNRTQTPEEKAREAALIAAANAAQPGTVENERLRKQEQLAQKGEAAWQSSMTDAKKLKGFLDQAIKDADWTSAGLIGQALSAVGGTSAADLESTLDTIKAKIGFNELQQMRKESPTGGALGQVAVQELKFLQAVEGSLNQKQTPAQLKKNLGLILESTARLEEDLRKNPPDWTGQKVRTPNQMQPAERPTGAPVPVASEAEANRLPKGTLIIINGRRAIVE